MLYRSSLIDSHLQTQSIEEEIGPIRVPSRSKAMLQNEVTPRDVSLHEITPREPEPHMLAPPLPLAVSQQRILTGSAAEPVSPASPMVPRKRGRTLRQRLTLRIRKVLVSYGLLFIVYLGHLMLSVQRPVTNYRTYLFA
ncbi:hypothetical protein Y032_0050g1994 [Ancylostoma ceylanicum]|uniref:Uncharacterized protein n=1 Tax=Ancylostoma ceylanicum TaxID=53326 RepID=A0A016U8Y3_9BILA|nr:hypothetical protein Y032_0050g1994 [Ancylostoma ceylanicum]